MATPATAAKAAPPTDTLTCPECGKTFTRAAGLGAHRKIAHGVAGASKNTAAKSASTPASRKPGKAGSSRRVRAAATPVNESGRTAAVRTTRTARPRRRVRAQAATSNGGAASVDRDALLRALFPQGIPPRQEVIGAVSDWLNEAERLAKTSY
jgi:hypothetical protein